MAKNRICQKPDKLRITVYPHIGEHNREKYFQAGVLVEEIPGIVDWSYIYREKSVKRLVGKLAALRNEWQRSNSYTYKIVRQAPGFERIFVPDSKYGEIRDMPEEFYKDFQFKFEKLICRR